MQPLSMFRFLTRSAVRPSLSLSMAVLATAASAQSYPLVCKAGASVKLNVGFANGRNFANIYFAPSGQPASAGVAPGACAWSDRGWRQGEPANLFLADVGHVVASFQNGTYSNVEFTKGDIRGLEGITRNTGQTFVFQVHAQGNSMVVDRVGP